MEATIICNVTTTAEMGTTPGYFYVWANWEVIASEAAAKGPGAWTLCRNRDGMQGHSSLIHQNSSLSEQETPVAIIARA